MRVSEERILNVAHELFKHKGVRTTKMQDVARSCGVSLWDVNVLFKSKKDLVLAVARHILSKKADHLLINRTLSASAVTELNTFFRFINDSLDDLGAELLTELRRYHPLSLDRLRDVVDIRLIPCLQENVERGIREGFYRNGLDSKVHASTYFFIIRTVLEGDQDWTETVRTITHISDVFAHGVLNGRGMRISQS